MHLSILTLPVKKKLYVSAKTQIYIFDESIPLIGAERQFKYLGFLFNYMGTIRSSLDAFKTTLYRLKSSPLKPRRPANILLKFQNHH